MARHAAGWPERRTDDGPFRRAIPRACGSRPMASRSSGAAASTSSSAAAELAELRERVVSRADIDTATGGPQRCELRPSSRGVGRDGERAVDVVGDPGEPHRDRGEDGRVVGVRRRRTPGGAVRPVPAIGDVAR